MNVKGTRDFLPEEMILRQQVLDKVRKVFETFGFQPLETPALESWEVLSAKGTGGEEILREAYVFEDKGKRKIGLKYDQTVPLARVMADNPNLPLPFKRYQIQNAWRYGDITKDRFREFLQADIDVVGSESTLADAEVIACAISCLNELGFKNFVVRLNDRKILEEIMKLSKVNNDEINDVLRSIDKLEKIGVDAVAKELEGKGISKDSIRKTLSFIEKKADNEKILKDLEKMEGAKELKEVISYLKIMNLDSKVRIDLSLARGLDYYTGPIFEVFAEEGIGSVAGGGRYDNMIGLFLKRNVPATGISLGIERIIEVMKERKMVDSTKSKTKVFVVAVNEKVRVKVLDIAQKLREKGLSVDYDLRSRSISKQLEYVDSLGIPFAVIVGEKELQEDSVKLRNMKTGEEGLVKINEIASKL